MELIRTTTKEKCRILKSRTSGLVTNFGSRSTTAGTCQLPDETERWKKPSFEGQHHSIVPFCIVKGTKIGVIGRYIQIIIKVNEIFMGSWALEP